MFIKFNVSSRRDCLNLLWYFLRVTPIIGTYWSNIVVFIFTINVINVWQSRRLCFSSHASYYMKKIGNLSWTGFQHTMIFFSCAKYVHCTLHQKWPNCLIYHDCQNSSLFCQWNLSINRTKSRFSDDYYHLAIARLNLITLETITYRQISKIWCR